MNDGATLAFPKPADGFGTVIVQAMTDDGPDWLGSAFVPSDDELGWAMHEAPIMRAAYAVKVTAEFRNHAERNGYEMGWQ